MVNMEKRESEKVYQAVPMTTNNILVKKIEMDHHLYSSHKSVLL